MSKVRISKAGARQAKAYELFLSTHIRHVDNDWAGEPFLLEDWQRENIWRPILGAGHMVNGRFARKYRRALIGLPRDGGKTEIAAALLLTIASMEPVPQGEYGVLASSKTQAQKAFRKMKAMILQDPDLRAMWEVFTDTIVHRETGARIIVLPYSEAATQSYHFNVCIIDEYHVHKNASVLEAVISGQKAIWNALTIVITTAGPKREGPLWELIAQWGKDLAAHVYWLGARDHEDMDDRKVWARVKPMSWISMADMEDQFASTSRHSFERYTINRFPLSGEAGRFFTPREIAKTRGHPTIDPKRPSYVTIDGADKSDHFVISLTQKDAAGGINVASWVLEEPPQELGYYDLEYIEDLLVNIRSELNVTRWALDGNRLRMLMIRMQNTYGFEVEEFPQTNQMMCPACNALRTVVREGRMHIGMEQALLVQHLKNSLELPKQPFGTRIGRVSVTEKIDGAITLAMGAFLWETAEEEVSFADNGGFHSVSLG
jgi:phage terminase large subunit-like protein